MKNTLFVLMLAAAAFVGCQKQEAAAPVAQDQAVAAPVTPEAAPASK